ncbi:MAG: RlmF-related methyltransferase, partial [Oceanospirillaceae bacterium]|nr:RlmF-related methyltransferase [Oceanospirillaceae bacterium]
LQAKADETFFGAIQKGEKFDLTICNPPFHASAKEAAQASTRKLINLKGERVKEKVLNFGGQKAELFCPGGELTFIKSMIAESTSHAHQVLYFTCLVSKKEHLFPLKVCLKKYQAADVQVIEMSQGNKISRFIAWSFLDKAQRQRWCKDKLAVR